MTRYLLDSNAVSDLVRNPAGVIGRRIAEIGEAHVATSAIVAAELKYGAAKKDSAPLKRQVELVLGRLRILPFGFEEAAVYGTVRCELERDGTPIGALDQLIAAQALTLGCTVVTENTREFSRVKGLRVENWLRAQ